VSYHFIVRSISFFQVSYKDAPFGSALVDDTQIKGNLELNAIVDVIHGKGTTIRAVINHIKDCSLYTVGECVPNLQINRHLSEFNDGDERNLRRTQLCLKGGKHFDAEHNLDALPLYNPEQFGNPVHATSSSVGVGSKTANQSIKRLVLYYYSLQLAPYYKHEHIQPIVVSF
jgi:hypothetical protein